MVGSYYSGQGVSSNYNAFPTMEQRNQGSHVTQLYPHRVSPILLCKHSSRYLVYY